MKFLCHLAVCGLVGAACRAGASPPMAHRAPMGPALNADFPDPSILKDSDGKWYAFATAGGGKQVQVASAPAPGGPWTLHDDANVLPHPGSWTTGQNTWAPDVRRLAEGCYVMFYSGQSAKDTAHHCVGTATAKSVLGPFTPSAEPLNCHLDQGGCIDPSGYYDEATGSRWIVYKMDGNSVGNGGDCNNGVPPIHGTPIMLQEMSKDDWTTPVGPAVQILDRTDTDGPLVEAPGLIRAADGTYVLTYSSHCYTSDAYDVRYATAKDITGPYERGGTLIKTGDFGGLASPGGATCAAVGGSLVFHANCGAGRCMYTAKFSVSGTKVTVS